MMNASMKKTVMTPLSALALIFALTLCGCNRVNPVVEMGLAIEDMKAGRLSEVIVRTDACLRVDHENLDARLLNSYCRFMMAGKEAERKNALYELGKCTRLYADSASAWYYYGYVLAQSNQLREALSPLRKALSLMPAGTPARDHAALLLAKCCVENNLQAEAASLLQPLQQRLPYARWPQLHNAMGMLALKRGQPRLAMGHFSNGLCRSRNNEALLQNLAVTADLYLNDVPAAMGYYRQLMVQRSRRGDREGMAQLQNRMRQLAKRQ